MLKRIREDSELGIQIVKKSVKDLVRRSLDEAESLKIRLEIRKKERDFDGISLQAGKMLFEKLQKGESQLDDPDLKSLFLKAAQVKEELDNLKTDLSDRINPVL
ncbi:MAG: hypothetical protein ACHQYP_05075 [Nitrospiria bacterium]